MGVVMLGRYTRVQWCPASPSMIAQLEADATSLTATVLLQGAQQAWGLAPGQPSLLTGYDVERSDGWEKDRIILLPDQPDIISSFALPRDGRWLVGVEHSGSMWAALRGVKVVDRGEIYLHWKEVDLPGAGPLTLGLPRRGKEPLMLIAPPPRDGALQARLDRNGMLLTTPFKSEKGREDEAPPSKADQLDHYLDGICHNVTPRYRYGLLEDGVMRWLNLASRASPVTVTPITAQFRTRLALFGRELSARGIFYEDDADETGYELRFAIEDGAVPSSFHVPDAALAYTVSGEGGPEDDKREQARQIYDPENDWETGQFYAIDFPSMPARIDVESTDLAYYTSEYTTIDGLVVDDAWAKAHLDVAGLLAGLDSGASTGPALAAVDLKRLEGATKPLPIQWNAVDAADRVQRAAYALATDGVPDPAVEAKLSRLRGPIGRVLLARDALLLAEAGNVTGAKAATAALPPLAPGPFPRRAYAVIDLADGLVEEARRPVLVAQALRAVDNLLEQRLALLFAARAGGRPEIIVRGAAIWAGHEGADVLVDAHRWGVDVAEDLLGALDPPDAPRAKVEDDQHIAPLALRRAIESGSANDFAAAWAAAEPAARHIADLWLLIKAVQYERFDIAELLIADGVPLSGRTEAANNALGQWGGETPLGGAIEARSINAVRWCVARGANPAAAEWSRGQTAAGEQVDWPTPALVLAAKHGHAEILQFFIEAGGDPIAPIANGITPLIAAAYGGSTECVELLLAAGADGNQQPDTPKVVDGPHATTPLLYACDRGHDNIVRLLLDRGADPRTPRSDGELPLQLAMEACALSTIQALVAAGADGAAVNRDGLSVLHTAMLKQRSDALPLLLAAGASVDLPAGDRGATLADTEPGWTALMIAAANGNAAGAVALLDAGANPLVIDRKGRTALELARLAGNPGAVNDPYDAVIETLEYAERRPTR